MSGRQTRLKEPVNYSEKAVSAAAPAWVKSQQLRPEPGSSGGSQQRHSHDGKENERGTATSSKHGEVPAKKTAKPAEAHAAGKDKAQEVPVRGRNAGLKHVPIVDKAKKQGGGNAAKGAEQKHPGKAGKQLSGSEDGGEELQLVTKEVLGLAGVKQRRLERVPAAAVGPAPNNGGSGPDRAPQLDELAAAAIAASTRRNASGKHGTSGSKHKRAAPAAEQQQLLPEAVQQPAAKRQRSKGSGAKSTAAAAAEQAPEKEGQGPQAQQEQRPPQQAAPAGDQAGPSMAGAAGAAARQRRPAGPEAAPAPTQLKDDGVLGRVARAVEAAVRAEAEAAGVPAEQGCQRCQHYSDNFAALLREYQGLQREYEALKAARLSEDVEELLREHNRHVTEHGAKAAELAAHWKQEADKRREEAEHAGQLLERCRELEGEVLGAQAELTDLQAAGLRKDTRIQELETRLQLLGRCVQLPDTHDQGMQSGGPQAHSAGVQAPSLQSPQAQSLGVQMYEARAMAPEGALGTVYKKRRPQAAPSPGGAAAVAADNTYTAPGTTPVPALAALLAAGEQQSSPSIQQGGVGAAIAAAAAAAATGGSDMQLTGEGPQEDQQVPVAGKLAHAAPRSVGRVATQAASPAPAPAPAADQQDPAAATERPGSAQLTAESLVHAPAANLAGALAVVVPQAATQARARRLSAPPAIGGAGSYTSAAPLERQLLFASASPYGGLPAVPEEASEGGHAPANMAAPASVPAPPRDGAVMMLGFEATPCKGGKYIFTDRPSGFVFELGPASPDSAGWGSSEEEGAGEGEGPELRYCALQLGSIAAVLPKFLHGQITIQAKYRRKLLHLVTEALAQATPGPQR